MLICAGSHALGGISWTELVASTRHEGPKWKIGQDAVFRRDLRAANDPFVPRAPGQTKKNFIASACLKSDVSLQRFLER